MSKQLSLFFLKWIYCFFFAAIFPFVKQKQKSRKSQLLFLCVFYFAQATHKMKTWQSQAVIRQFSVQISLSSQPITTNQKKSISELTIAWHFHFFLFSFAFAAKHNPRNITSQYIIQLPEINKQKTNLCMAVWHVLCFVYLLFELRKKSNRDSCYSVSPSYFKNQDFHFSWQSERNEGIKNNLVEENSSECRCSMFRKRDSLKIYVSSTNLSSPNLTKIKTRFTTCERKSTFI